MLLYVYSMQFLKTTSKLLVNCFIDCIKMSKLFYYFYRLVFACFLYILQTISYSHIVDYCSYYVNTNKYMTCPLTEGTQLVMQYIQSLMFLLHVIELARTSARTHGARRIVNNSLKVGLNSSQLSTISFVYCKYFVLNIFCYLEQIQFIQEYYSVKYILTSFLIFNG